MKKGVALFAMVARAFLAGTAGSPFTGDFASMIQIGPKKSFVFFDGDDVIYETVLDVDTLELSTFDPPECPKAQVVHKAVLTYVKRIKKAQDSRLVPLGKL